MSNPTTVRLNEFTERQVDALKAAGFGSFTNIVQTAIDRMYQQEKENFTMSKGSFNFDNLDRYDFATVVADAAMNYANVMNGARVYYDPYKDTFGWTSTLTPNTGEITVADDVKAEDFGADSDNPEDEESLIEFINETNDELWEAAIAAIAGAIDLDPEDAQKYALWEDEGE